jgi:hypothetical protein
MAKPFTTDGISAKIMSLHSMAWAPTGRIHAHKLFDARFHSSMSEQKDLDR